MPDTPEPQARRHFDRLLAAAGWSIQDSSRENLYESRGIAVREFPLRPGPGFADYLLYVDKQPVDAREAAIDANFKRAAGLRQAILKRAFAGQLVPQDLNYAPASILLERIRTDAPAVSERINRSQRKTRDA